MDQNNNFANFYYISRRLEVIKDTYTMYKKKLKKITQIEFFSLIDLFNLLDFDRKSSKPTKLNLVDFQLLLNFNQTSKLNLVRSTSHCTPLQMIRLQMIRQPSINDTMGIMRQLLSPVYKQVACGDKN